MAAEPGSRRGWRAPLQRLDTVDSTNSWLRTAALVGAAPWTAVTARCQTEGRGRRGRAWSSPPGGLYLSVLVERGLPESQAVVPLLSGVAVARALEGWSVEARLKWPNDVRVGGRKVGGVLVEALPARKMLIVGIGVNVNARPDAGPVGGDAAASLAEILGHELDVDDVALAVLAQMALCYDALAESGAGAVVALWRGYAEDWWGRGVSVTVAGEPERVRLLDVAPGGALLVEAQDGSRRELLSGDVELLRLADGA